MSADRPISAEAAEIGRLNTELAARIAEANWLKAHYEHHLREAHARRPPVAPPRAEAASPPNSAQGTAELAALRADVERMTLAEKRYLDRIEELKDEVGRAHSREGVAK